MSQFYVGGGGGGGGGSTTFVTDSGSAAPAANILNILGGTGAETSASGNTVTVTVSDLVEGTGTTIGAVTADLITFSLGAAAAVYHIVADIAGYDITTPSGVTYEVINGIRTTGAAITFTGFDDLNAFEEVLTGCSAEFQSSGNNLIVRVTGSAGVTIRWKATLRYTKVL